MPNLSLIRKTSSPQRTSLPFRGNFTRMLRFCVFFLISVKNPKTKINIGSVGRYQNVFPWEDILNLDPAESKSPMSRNRYEEVKLSNTAVLKTDKPHFKLKALFKASKGFRALSHSTSHCLRDWSSPVQFCLLFSFNDENMSFSAASSPSISAMCGAASVIMSIPFSVSSLSSEAFYFPAQMSFWNLTTCSKSHLSTLCWIFNAS